MAHEGYYRQNHFIRRVVLENSKLRYYVFAPLIYYKQYKMLLAFNNHIIKDQIN